MLIGDTYTGSSGSAELNWGSINRSSSSIDYIWNALHGDFGISYRTRNPVFDEVFSRFPHTVAITFLSIIILVVVGVIVGIVAAVKPIPS